MTTTTRWWRFNGVGLAGIAVQLGTLWWLTRVCGAAIGPATAIAVTVAIVHNFVWHRRWTWADRPSRPLVSFASFATTNGLMSLVGNVAITSALVTHFSLPTVAANLIAIGVCGLVNYVVADRLVFMARTRSEPPRVTPVPSYRSGPHTSRRDVSHTSPLPEPGIPARLPLAARDPRAEAARRASHRVC